MRSRYRIYNPSGGYFITCSIVEWLPVLALQPCRDALVETIEYYRKHRSLQLYSWVILYNHFHAIVAGPELSDTIRDLKKYTARRFIEILKDSEPAWMLEMLRTSKAEHKTASTYQVWQEGFHPIEVDTDEIMAQKIHYIEQNLVVKGWVLDAEHWRYSSAHERMKHVKPVMVCDPWR